MALLPNGLQVHRDLGLQPEAMAMLGEVVTEVLSRLLALGSGPASAAYTPLELRTDTALVHLGLPARPAAGEVTRG